MKTPKTYTPKPIDIETDWHLFDATDEILGKLAAKVAKLLIGKHKAMYTANINVGDKVVIKNASKIAVTGNKLKNKKYYWHTGFPGGIREETLEKRLARKPTQVLEFAVKGMLPKNKLRKVRMKNLFVYAGDTHPHEAQIKGVTESVKISKKG